MLYVYIIGFALTVVIMLNAFRGQGVASLKSNYEEITECANQTFLWLLPSNILPSRLAFPDKNVLNACPMSNH